MHKQRNLSDHRYPCVCNMSAHNPGRHTIISLLLCYVFFKCDPIIGRHWCLLEGFFYFYFLRRKDNKQSKCLLIYCKKKTLIIIQTRFEPDHMLTFCNIHDVIIFKAQYFSCTLIRILLYFTTLAPPPPPYSQSSFLTVMKQSKTNLQRGLQQDRNRVVDYDVAAALTPWATFN